MLRYVTRRSFVPADPSRLAGRVAIGTRWGRRAAARHGADRYAVGCLAGHDTAAMTPEPPSVVDHYQNGGGSWWSGGFSRADGARSGSGSLMYLRPVGVVIS
jgi:hypothetical protein